MAYRITSVACSILEPTNKDREMNFLELTPFGTSNKPILVNMDLVTSIHPKWEQGSTLYFNFSVICSNVGGPEFEEVKEEMSEIKTLISNLK